MNSLYKEKQSGAVEACWAHNPEVRRSKLRSAKNIFFFFFSPFCGKAIKNESNQSVES